MQDNRFDTITRTFASGVSRRSALRGFGGGLAALGAARFSHAGAQEATPAASPAASPVSNVAGFGQEFLFVQTFTGGTWAAKAGEDGVYTLSLAGSAAQTVYFSDRPERIVGTVPTERFLATLGFLPDNPPNAALVTDSGGDEDVLVLELFNPAYDADAGTLTYDARVLEDYQEEGLQFVAERQQDAGLPDSFGQTSLYIDNCNDINSCYDTDLNVVGPVPGAPIGTCWQWSALQCLPCSGASLNDLNVLCTETYPTQCADGCYVSVE